MHPDYGKQLGQAFAAIHQLHRDVSRMMMDLYPRLGQKRGVGTAVIKDTSWQWNAPDKWMPYSACMVSTGGDLPTNTVEMVMAYFWDHPPKPQEPYLVLVRIAYKMTEDGKFKHDTWDAWAACFDWGEPFPDKVVNHFSPNDGRVETVTITAVPLFDITSVDDVLKHMNAVRDRAALV